LASRPAPTPVELAALHGDPVTRAQVLLAARITRTWVHAYHLSVRNHAEKLRTADAEVLRDLPADGAHPQLASAYLGELYQVLARLMRLQANMRVQVAANGPAQSYARDADGALVVTLRHDPALPTQVPDIARRLLEAALTIDPPMVPGDIGQLAHLIFNIETIDPDGRRFAMFVKTF
jgi:hypothetical protein